MNYIGIDIHKKRKIGVGSTFLYFFLDEMGGFRKENRGQLT